ncbi:hypothetical protein BN3590_03692 [Clostridium sp. C105KSO15]|nr:hypothetical protein BN3590_03692 [Clostridium sp. C105KSO15]
MSFFMRPVFFKGWPHLFLTALLAQQQNRLYPSTRHPMINRIVTIVAGIKSRIAMPAPKQNSISPHTLLISSLNPFRLYNILCGLSPSYYAFSFSSAAAISSATFNASGETSFVPPANLLTKSGTISKIFVTASCCLMFTSFVTPF